MTGLDDAYPSRRHAVAVTGGSNADQARGIELELVEIMPLGGGGHRGRALAGGKADHAAFRQRSQMRRQHHVGMGSRDGRVKDRAEEGAPVGHDISASPDQLLSSPLMTSPNNCQR